VGAGGKDHTQLLDNLLVAHLALSASGGGLVILGGSGRGGTSRCRGSSGRLRLGGVTWLLSGLWRNGCRLGWGRLLARGRRCRRRLWLGGRCHRRGGGAGGWGGGRWGGFLSEGPLNHLATIGDAQPVWFVRNGVGGTGGNGRRRVLLLGGTRSGPCLKKKKNLI